MMNARKKQIVNAAYDLFIEKGYAATSIQDVLDKAGISKGTFYNHFTSKGECLRAILELIVEEIESRRALAAAGKQPDDRAVMSEQIAIRMRLSKERNLFALYESIFYSEEAELKALAKQLHFNELCWMARRIIDVYGEKAEPYALENAALTLGMIQHLIHLSAAKAKREMSPDELTNFALRRMEASLNDQLSTGDSFLPFSLCDLQTEQPSGKHQSVRTKLHVLAQTAENDSIKQRAAFIANELDDSEPRIHLVRSVLSSLEEQLTDEGKLLEEVRSILKER